MSRPGHTLTLCIVSFPSIFGSLREVEAGAKRLAQVILGTSHLPQTAIPALLDPADNRVSSWKLDLRAKLEEQAALVCAELSQVAGLEVIKPGGAMYTLVLLEITSFDETITSDTTFCEALLQEENVFVLPGSCFGAENMIRIVYCAPSSVLSDAANRIRSFCLRHSLNHS